MSRKLPIVITIIGFSLISIFSSFIAGIAVVVGMWMLKNHNSALKTSTIFSLVMTVGLFFGYIFIQSPYVNLTTLIFFAIAHCILLISVHIYIKGVEYGDPFRYRFRVGFNLLVIGEGIKVIGNALKLNFSNSVIEYLIAVGYMLPVVALVYIGLEHYREEKRKDSLRVGIHKHSSAHK